MKLNNRNINNDKTNITSSAIYRFVPYWPLFFLLLLIGLGAGWLYLQYILPKYQVSASILIKDKRKGAEESNVLQDLNIYTSKKIVENEIEVLHSRKLMKNVVNELHLYAPVYEKKWLNSKSAYSTSPIVVMVKSPDLIKENVPMIPFSFVNNSIVINDKNYPLNSWVSTPYGQLRFEPNAKKVQDGTHPMFFKLLTTKAAVSSFVGNLNITPASKLSTVAQLTIKDEVPQRGEDVLNKLIDVYNQVSVSEKNAVQTNTFDFIQQRLKGIELELGSLETRIQKFRSAKGAVNLSEQGKLFLQTVGDNDLKISDIKLRLSALDQVESYVQSKDNKSAIVPSTLGVTDPGLSQLMQRMYNAKLDYEKTRETTGDKNPIVVTIGKEIEEIRPSILEKIYNERKSLEGSLNNLRTSGAVYDGMLRAIPLKERELTEISREQAIMNNIYSFLLQKREETGLAISSTEPDSRIVDASEASPNPVSPQRSVVYIAACLLPLIFGVGGIYSRELLSKKILFRSDLDSFTGFPVTGEISRTKERDAHFAANQFRQLRGAMGLRDQNSNNKKRVLITSNIAGEGKTFISTNLALSLAVANKKVVLVDLNVYNPSASSALLMSSKKGGVAEFLEGRLHADEIVNKSFCNPNLFVVEAGSETTNTKELLLNGNLNELLKYLDERFDYIIIDTCPVDQFPEAYAFSDYCDRTLLVVRHDYTPKIVVKMLDTNKKIQNLKNVSLVFNDVKPRGIIKGKYGFEYGFGYENFHQNKTRTPKERVTSPVVSEEFKTTAAIQVAEA